MCRAESPIYERSEKIGTPHIISHKNNFELCLNRILCRAESPIYERSEKIGTPHLISHRNNFVIILVAFSFPFLTENILQVK